MPEINPDFIYKIGNANAELDNEQASETFELPRNKSPKNLEQSLFAYFQLKRYREFKEMSEYSLNNYNNDKSLGNLNTSYYTAESSQSFISGMYIAEYDPEESTDIPVRIFVDDKEKGLMKFLAKRFPFTEIVQENIQRILSLPPNPVIAELKREIDPEDVDDIPLSEIATMPIVPRPVINSAIILNQTLNLNNEINQKVHANRLEKFIKIKKIERIRELNKIMDKVIKAGKLIKNYDQLDTESLYKKVEAGIVKQNQKLTLTLKQIIEVSDKLQQNLSPLKYAELLNKRKDLELRAKKLTQLLADAPNILVALDPHATSFEDEYISKISKLTEIPIKDLENILPNPYALSDVDSIKKEIEYWKKELNKFDLKSPLDKLKERVLITESQLEKLSQEKLKKKGLSDEEIEFVMQSRAVNKFYNFEHLMNEGRSHKGYTLNEKHPLIKRNKNNSYAAIILSQPNNNNTSVTPQPSPPVDSNYGYLSSYANANNNNTNSNNINNPNLNVNNNTMEDTHYDPTVSNNNNNNTMEDAQNELRVSRNTPDLPKNIYTEDHLIDFLKYPHEDIDFNAQPYKRYKEQIQKLLSDRKYLFSNRDTITRSQETGLTPYLIALKYCHKTEILDLFFEAFKRMGFPEYIINSSPETNNSDSDWNSIMFTAIYNTPKILEHLIKQTLSPHKNAVPTLKQIQERAMMALSAVCETKESSQEHSIAIIKFLVENHQVKITKDMKENAFANKYHRLVDYLDTILITQDTLQNSTSRNNNLFQNRVSQNNTSNNNNTNTSNVTNNNMETKSDKSNKRKVDNTYSTNTNNNQKDTTNNAPRKFQKK